jgi:hypothetical protein
MPFTSQQPSRGLPQLDLSRNVLAECAPTPAVEVAVDNSAFPMLGRVSQTLWRPFMWEVSIVAVTVVLNARVCHCEPISYEGIEINALLH